MAWSPPECQRRLWLVEQAGDYATNLFPPHPRRHPAELFGSLVVVFDGHNALSLSQSNAFVSSNQEWRADTRPLDVERLIVTSVRKRFAHADVHFIDTVGTPMEFAVFWIAASSYFVAP